MGSTAYATLAFGFSVEEAKAPWARDEFEFDFGVWRSRQKTGAGLEVEVHGDLPSADGDRIYVLTVNEAVRKTYVGGINKGPLDVGVLAAPAEWTERLERAAAEWSLPVSGPPRWWLLAQRK